ncbi:MAG: T9SS type A sorting domain-containing protein [Bacteroidales bacterium]|nr:T9SS type A sorting domain-containing protein [Bacteroidales bacterium]
MKTLFNSICLIFLINLLSAQNWQQSEGIPDTLWIYDIAVCDDYVFAATMYGIYRSSDYGINWEPKNNGINPENTNTRAFAKSGNRIYVANMLGVFSSDDNGEHWSNMNLPYQNPALSVFADDSILLAGVPGGGLYRSADYGETWFGVSGDHFYKIAKYQNFYFAGSWFDVLISDDHGVTWDYSGLSEITYWVINYMDSIYACPFGGGLYKTSPLDIGWIYVVGIKQPVNGISKAETGLFVVTSDNVYYKSGDNPEMGWQELTTDNLPLSDGNYLWSIAVSDEYIIVGTQHNSGKGAGIWYCSLNDIPNSINDTEANNETLIFPNPSGSVINIDHFFAVERAYFEIIDQHGVVIKFGLLQESFLDISILNKGIYYLKLISCEKISIHKFVVN